MAGEPILPGAVHGRGQVILNDGSRLTGHVLWAPESSVDGKAFSRRRVQVIMFRSDGGVLPGSGRRIVTEDGRTITGYLASDLDEGFIDLLPHEGHREAGAYLRRERLRRWTNGKPTN